MRILVITPTFLPVVGGAETGIYEIYKRLSNDHSIKILTPYLPKKDRGLQGAADSFYDENIFEVKRFYDVITSGKTSLKRIWQRFIPPVSLSYVWAVVKEVRSFKPDVINFHYLFPGALALRAVQRFTSVPVVLSLVSRTDTFGNDNPLYPHHSSFMEKSVRAATKVTALTKFMIADSKVAKIPKIIPYGADTERFNPQVKIGNVLDKLEIKPTSKVLFTLQRLSKIKRVDFLIKTMSHLPEDTILVIGGKGPETENLKRLCQSSKLSERIIFAGYISEEDLPAYFSASSLFLFSSASETFGIVLAQALSSGTPVAALDSTCVSEVVTNGHDGLIVNTLDPKVFAEMISPLLDDKEKLAKLSENARKSATNRYSWDLIATAFEGVLKEAALAES